MTRRKGAAPGTGDAHHARPYGVPSRRESSMRRRSIGQWSTPGEAMA
jgi:hypothetical protein